MIEEFLHAVRADVSANAREALAEGGDDPDSLARCGGPTPSELAAINSRCALSEQSPDGLFVWGIETSNTLTDSHGTWMHESTLQNYRHQARNGRGVPYLQDHKTDQGTTGRVFNALLVDEGKRSASVDDGMIPTARDLLHPDRKVLRLHQLVYMARGERGSPEERYIRKLESGVQASNSVGFSVYTPTSPGSLLRCDICGVDMFRVSTEECAHLPGWETEVELAEDRGGDTKTVRRVIATAAVINGTQREVSGVYLGSTPGTYTLARRARQLVEEGHYGPKQAVRMEEHYRSMGVQIDRGFISGLPGRTVMTFGEIRSAAPDRGRDDDVESTMANDGLLSRVRELVRGDSELLGEFELLDPEDDPVAALHRAHEARRKVFETERDEAEEREQAVRAAVAEALGLDADRSIGEQLPDIKAELSFARTAREQVYEEYFRQSARVGMPVSDEEKDDERRILDRMTPVEIQAKIEKMRKAADGTLEPGRTSDPELESRSNGSSDGAERPMPWLVG